MAGHIEKHRLKSGKTCYRVKGTGLDNNRARNYHTVHGTKKEAEALLLAKLLSELNTGCFIEPSKLSTKDYFIDWVTSYVIPNLSPTTADSYGINIEKHLIPGIGHIPLQQLKPMHVQNLYRSLQENGRTDGKGGLSAT